eukprot:TRINITY_DN40620_c0_g1_i1.p1 TRINITY_DN40620_c0_g1~~TRINITY_DN40620_c0_g1_i1.p1  ORF type:complete len:294 (+),score=54.33 TRINITY_DN40620_c0_g1_i1:229-1110(+)
MAASSALQSPLPFTPQQVDESCCLARTWNRGLGGQCGRPRPRSGAAFCGMHARGEKWQVNGRVDGPIPEPKLKQFQAVAARASPGSCSKKASADRMDATPEVRPRKCLRQLSPVAVDRPAASFQQRRASVGEKKVTASEAASPSTLSRCAAQKNSAPPTSVADLLREVPDFGGRLAELLWEVSGRTEEYTLGRGHFGALHITRRKLEPAIPSMLTASKDIQLMTIIGIKERRLVSMSTDVSPEKSRVYATMCDCVTRACPQAWAESRKFRLCSTESADMLAAQQLLAAHGLVF